MFCNSAPCADNSTDAGGRQHDDQTSCRLAPKAVSSGTLVRAGCVFRVAIFGDATTAVCDVSYRPSQLFATMLVYDAGIPAI